MVDGGIGKYVFLELGSLPTDVSSLSSHVSSEDVMDAKLVMRAWSFSSHSRPSCRVLMRLGSWSLSIEHSAMAAANNMKLLMAMSSEVLLAEKYSVLRRDYAADLRMELPPFFLLNLQANDF